MLDDKMILNDELPRMLKQFCNFLKYFQRICLEEEKCGMFRPNSENWTYKIPINDPKVLYSPTDALIY